MSTLRGISIALLGLFAPIATYASEPWVEAQGVEPEWRLDVRGWTLSLAVGEVYTRVEVGDASRRDGHERVEGSTPDGRELAFEWWPEACVVGEQHFELSARLEIGGRTLAGCAVQHVE